MNERPDRKKITFEQAEGLAPLPTQLALKELSKELRAGLWYLLHEEHIENLVYSDFNDRWLDMLRREHVLRYALPIDEFSADPKTVLIIHKRIVLEAPYHQVLGLFEWLIRQRETDENFAEGLQQALVHHRAAYRVVDGDTISAIASETDAATVQKAFADVAGREFQGARTHLRLAAEKITAGDNGGGIREAMHAVESVVRLLSSEKDFSTALTELEKRWPIHGALKSAFRSLYGYSSDEQGIRHALIDKGSADVDEADALYMMASCSAVVSHLIHKSRLYPKK